MNYIYMIRDRIGTREGPITVKPAGKHNFQCHRAAIVDREGRVVAAIVHDPDNPLKNGARVWIETDLDVIAVREPLPVHPHFPLAVAPHRDYGLVIFESSSSAAHNAWKYPHARVCVKHKPGEVG